MPAPFAAGPCGRLRLERPTTEALAALCYAYFDTRPTPLAELNMVRIPGARALPWRVERSCVCQIETSLACLVSH